jgi:hypothetical protein
MDLFGHPLTLVYFRLLLCRLPDFYGGEKNLAASFTA